MKVAGTVTDATAIRAALDKAAGQLTPAHNPNSLDGVDEKGGTLADTRVAVIEGGKVKEVKLSSLKQGLGLDVIPAQADPSASTTHRARHSPG